MILVFCYYNNKNYSFINYFNLNFNYNVFKLYKFKNIPKHLSVNYGININYAFINIDFNRSTMPETYNTNELQSQSQSHISNLSPLR